MTTTENLAAFKKKILGTWCNQENGSTYSVFSTNKIVITQKGFQPMAFNYELCAAEHGFLLLFDKQKLEIEVLEETEETLVFTVSHARVITLKRCSD